MHYEPSVPALSPDLAVMAKESDENSVYRKITLRIMPIIFLAYVLAFLDRINVGYTQLQMKQDLGFSDAVYGLGAGLFFITYLLFEVPSNLWLEKIGARLTFLRIMVLWGLASAATMFVTEPWQFYTIRLLLGVFEAGFFPGVILYLTYWYPSHRRGSITGLFLFGMPITGVLGGPLSGMIMSQMHGVNGWEGWQWVFLLEGVPTAIVGVVLYLVLANRPSEAKWLTDREKAVVEGVMAADRKGEESGHGHGKLRAALADPKTFVLAFIYFCCACAVYTFTFWLPTMIRELGVASLTEVGWYTVIPYAFGALGILVLSRSSDRLRERRWHVASTLIVGSIYSVPDNLSWRGFLAHHGSALHRGILHFRMRAVLVDPSDLPEPGGRRRRHRRDQFARHPRRFRQPIHHRHDQERDGEHGCGPRRHDGGHRGGRCGDPGRPAG